MAGCNTDAYMRLFLLLQPGKKAIDLIIDFLSCLWDYAKQQITREIGAVADLGACLSSTNHRLAS